MEETLRQILKEINKSKHGTIQKACQEALDLLEDRSISLAAQPHQLRTRCLHSLQLTLESKNSRLSSLALTGMQHILKEERFQSCMESEEEGHWLSMQVLAAVRNTATLPEDIQVEVMRLLLNMTMTSSQCMNAPVIINIAKLCFDAILIASRQTLRNFIVNTFLRMLHLFMTRVLASLPGVTNEVMVEAYSLNGQCSVKTAARATFTQLLSTLTEKLIESDAAMNLMKDSAVGEFSTKGSAADAEVLSNDVVTILQYLCDRLSTSAGVGHGSHAEPLLLEGILTILCKLPESVTRNEQFRDLVWQKLCPSLISILANPMADKTVVAPQRSSSVSDEIGRGSGCSATAPNILTGSAKTIYSISVHLVRALGRFASHRPVLESLFHRMLLYPPPIHRLDAVKAVRPLLSSSVALLVLAGPMIPESNARLNNGTSASTKKRQNNELRLLKLIVDSIQECCHCNDSAVAIISVDLINRLLTSVEELVRGHGISREQATAIHKLYEECKDFSTNHASKLEVEAEIEADSESESESESEPDSEDADVADDAAAAAEKKDVRKDGEQIIYRTQTTTTTDSTERICAKLFIDRLIEFLPSLFAASNVTKADELIQTFSSNFCKETSDQNGQEMILNADAIYVTTYSVLQLSYNLLCLGYYNSHEKSLPIPQQQFIEDILNTGLLLYLSRAWLSEVFHQVISQNILPSDIVATSSHFNLSSSVFVQLLTDINGLNSKKVSGQLLLEFQESHLKVADVVLNEDCEENSKIGQTPEKEIIESGMMFARKILTICWDGILDVLSVLTSGRSSCGITGSLVLLFNAKEESRKAREAICMSLEGLQKAARLSSILGLQDRCGSVFAQLATASCVVELEDIKRERHQHQQQQQHAPDRKPAVLASVLTAAMKPKLARLHAAHALSMDVLLSIGLELGSHTADCWQHVFRCCVHISELEHTYFSFGHDYDKIGGSGLIPLRQSREQTNRNDNNADDDNVEPTELYSTMGELAEPVTPTINVRELIHQSCIEAGWESDIVGGGVLSASQASKVLCGLSQEVDRLYDDAAYKLNMRSLVSFLGELCRCSHQQLAKFGRRSSGGDGALLPTNALLLFRLGDIMSKCVRRERPLLHIMRAWNVVSQHLVEAACHRDRSISKKAIGCIHEVVTMLLSSRTELPHFHFNESLCKPFENLLCLELCDGDAQDQIVCSICELVEACTSNIKSGWKPIFGALRAVKIRYTTNEEINEARQRHIAAVLDVFNVFLGTDNVLVFANAAVDCVLCLLKYIRGPGEFEEKDDDDSDFSDDGSAFGDNQDLCLPALQYIKQCADFLTSMWLMPNCPVFVGAKRIHTESCRPIEPLLSNIDINEFKKPFLENLNKSDSHDLNAEAEDDSSRSDSKTRLDVNADEKESITEEVDDGNETLLKKQSHRTKTEEEKTENDFNSEEISLIVDDSRKETNIKYSSLNDVGNVELNDDLKIEDMKSDLQIDDLGIDMENDLKNELKDDLSEDDFRNSEEKKDEDLLMRSKTNDDDVVKTNDDVMKTNDDDDERRCGGGGGDGIFSRVEEKMDLKDLSKSRSNEELERTTEEEQKIRRKSWTKKMDKTTDEVMLRLLDRLTETLDDMDNHTGTLHVFFLVIEGLSSAVSACPKNYQPQTLDVLFQLMRTVANIPGPRFALYCVNMLLLPTLQSWLRRGTSVSGIQQRNQSYWNAVTVANCKHYTGLCVDLVVEYIIQFTSQPELKAEVELLLHQQLMVLVEFITEPVESLSRIGCSCIRHCLLHCGPVLSESQWQIAVAAMKLAFDVTLFPLRQLMTPFHENSDNFYGDVGEVKVAVRLDSTPHDCQRLEQLSQQVFLLDSQRKTTANSSTINYEDEKSFIFLIYSPEGTEEPSATARVPFRNLVIGLLSHQLLVQTIGCLLLSGTSNVVPMEVGMMSSSASDSRNSAGGDNVSNVSGPGQQNLMHNPQMPGLLEYMSCRNAFTLLQCLVDSYRVAFQFDSRPGLKFLVQKVLRTDVAANMYKQAGISLTVYIHILLEIAAHQENICVQNIDEMLLQRFVLDVVQNHENENEDGILFNQSALHSPVVSKHQRALECSRQSTDLIVSHVDVFVCLLKEAFDEASCRYVDLYLDREGPSVADRLSQSLLVFLLAEPEELPSLKRDKSLMEMVTDKLRKQQQQHGSGGGEADEKEGKRRESKDSLRLDGEQLASLELKEVLTPHRHRASIEDRVYTVATDKTIKSLMSEYRKRKQAQSMPKSTKGNNNKTRDENKGESERSSQNVMEKQIEEQQKSSIMKDSEAHLRSWVEMLCNALQLLHQLPDNQFHALQPIFFHSIVQITSNCKDPQLRQALGQWTMRIGRIFGIAGPHELH